jgi:hypothetical protein
MQAIARAARAMAWCEEGNCKEEGDGWIILQKKSFVSTLDQPIAKRLPRGVGY